MLIPTPGGGLVAKAGGKLVGKLGGNALLKSHVARKALAWTLKHGGRKVLHAGAKASKYLANHAVADFAARSAGHLAAMTGKLTGMYAVQPILDTAAQAANNLMDWGVDQWTSSP